MNSWRWRRKEVYATPQWGLFDGRGRERITIWENEPNRRYTWHSWDENGTGGENAEESSLNEAKDRSVAALVRQGWAPGGWRIRW